MCVSLSLELVAAQYRPYSAPLHTIRYSEGNLQVPKGCNYPSPKLVEGVSTMFSLKYRNRSFDLVPYVENDIHVLQSRNFIPVKIPNGS